MEPVKQGPRTKRPDDHVCNACGSDEIYLITEAAIPLNGDGGYEDYSDDGSYRCFTCDEYDGYPVLRSEYAEDIGFEGPWAVVRRVWDGQPTKPSNITYYVDGFHPNGEHVASWEGPSAQELKQTMGPPVITLGMLENLQEAFNLCQ